MKLYRSAYDRKLTGLCGGLGQILNVDATIIRLLLIILVVFSGGAVILVYLLASLVVPKEPMDPNGYVDGNPRHSGRHFSGAFRNHPGAAGDFPHFDPVAKPHLGPYPSSKLAEDQSLIDSLLENVEKKALLKELEELRAKVAKYEKNAKGDV